MSGPNLYPEEIRCEINGFFTYVPVSVPGTYSITDFVLFQLIGGFIDSVTGVISIKSTRKLEPTLFEITGPTNTDISTFYITVFQSLNNNLWFTAFVGSQALDPSYNALPPLTYDYSYNLTSSAAPGDTGAIAPYSTTLPPGMTLSESSGVFQGTFTFFSIWPFTTYNVVVNKASKGMSWTQVSLAVDVVPVFTYTDSPYLAIPGEAVSIEPTIGTGAIGVIYFVSPQSPALPTGLTLNSSTAVISGIPGLNTVSTNTYTIVAQTSSGSPVGRYEASLVIYVNIPPSFNYPFSPYVLTQNVYAEIIPSSYLGNGSAIVPVTNYTYIDQPKIINEVLSTDGSCACYIGNSQILYFGGRCLFNTGSGGVYLNGTWILNCATNVWTNIVVPGSLNSPSGRQDAGIAYNSNTEQVYLFGGLTISPDGLSDVFYNDTWVFDLATSTWSELSVAGNIPNPRTTPIAYDSILNQIILFGGLGAFGSIYGDFFQLDCLTHIWTQIPTTGGGGAPPPPLFGFNFIAGDDGTSTFYLYGGQNGSGQYNQMYFYSNSMQLWEFYGPFSPITPTNYTTSNLVYDPINQQFILYVTGLLVVSPYTSYTSTYIFNVNTPPWVLLTPTVIPAVGVLPAKQSIPMVYVPENGGSTFLLAYYTTIDEQSPSLVPETCVFTSNGSTFNQWNVLKSQSPPVGYYAYAFNAVSNKMVFITSIRLWDYCMTWVYDLSTKIWTDITDPVNPIPNLGNAGGYPSLVYNSVNDTFILIGVLGGSTCVFTININTLSWAFTSTSGQTPNPRTSAAAVFDIQSGLVVYFGGQAVIGASPYQTFFNDTWTFNPGTSHWNEVYPVFLLSPPPRSACGFTYDSDNSKIIIFGGTNGPSATTAKNVLNDLWSFDVSTSTWLELIDGNDLVNTPSPRDETSLAYDTVAKQSLLFGGLNQAKLLLNDTWGFNYANNSDVNNWVDLNPSNAPTTTNCPSRFLTVYDVINNIFLVMDPTLFNFNNWLLQPVAPIPAPDVPFNVLYTVCEPENPPDYTAFPPLPYGLTLDPTTGIISGIPTVLQGPHVYSITGTNDAGTSTASLIISVVRPYTGGRDVGYCYEQIPDFEMRHKATVLQYTKNKAGFTKKQLWSQAVRGNGQYAKRTWGTQSVNYANPNVNGLQQQGNQLLCPSNPVICQPTYNSDVPGPVMQLCQNTSLPPVNLLPHRQLTLNGTKWPQTQWSPQRGGNGFPRGKAGSGLFFFK